MTRSEAPIRERRIKVCVLEITAGIGTLVVRARVDQFLNGKEMSERVVTLTA